MRYTSTINNIKCIEWDLTLSQAFLMDILVISDLWAKRETIDGVDYRWVSRNKIVEEIPHAYKAADTVYRSLKDLAKKGIIEYEKLGKKDLIRFTEKGKEWVFCQNGFDEKVGNKSELQQNSEINPSKFGNKSELNSEINPTDNGTNTNNGTNDNGSKSAPKKSKKKVAEKFVLEKPESVSEQVWKDLLAHRKKKGASDSQTAWTRIFNSLGRAQKVTGHNLDKIISYWIVRNWTGFDDEWYVNAHRTQINQGNTHAANKSANSKPQRETTEQYKERTQREFNELFGIEVQPDSDSGCYS